MAKLPFHIETPSLFVLPENIKNSHFKIKCQMPNSPFFVVVVIPSRLISQCFGFFLKGKTDLLSALSEASTKALLLQSS